MIAVVLVGDPVIGGDGVGQVLTIERRRRLIVEDADAMQREMGGLGRREIGDDFAAESVGPEAVGSGVAGEIVGGAIAEADEGIVSGAAADEVGACAAVERVVSAAADEGVVAGGAVELHGNRHACADGDGVVPAAAVDDDGRVVALAGGKEAALTGNG